MGKIRIKTLGLDEVEKKQKQQAKVRRQEKKSKKKAELEKEVKKDESIKQQKPVEKEQEKKLDVDKKTKQEDKKETRQKKAEVKKPSKKIKIKGKKYKSALKNIDKNKLYQPQEAIELLKKIKFTKFDSSVELHLVLKEKNIKGEVMLPHGIGKKVRVAIVDDKLLEVIDGGKIDFDILIAHPSYMPKLVKYAKILGPKGLMPNPKAGTVSENPKEVAEKYQKGSMKYKSEKDNPLIHQIIGKLSFENNALKENLEAFIKSINKSKIQTAYLCSTMSPSIKLDLEIL